MDDLDELRTDHSIAMLAQGRGELAVDPQLGFYHIWSSRLVLVTMHLKNNGDLPGDEVIDVVRELNEIILEHNIALHLEKQNELLILALAAGYVSGAQTLATIVCRENDSHKFDRVLNRKLRAAILHVSVPDDLVYRPSKTEQLMFLDLDTIMSGQKCELDGTEKYWQATRSRRYANTEFAYRNLFGLAFNTLQTHVTRR
jgi:hypothetical protein